jgi:hypothetical protein
MKSNVSSDKNMKRRSSTGTTSQLHNFVKEHLLSDFKKVEHEPSKCLEDDSKERQDDVQLHKQLQKQLELQLQLHLDSSINSTDIDSLAGEQNSETSIAYSDDILSSSDEADQTSQAQLVTTIRKSPENTSIIIPEKSEKRKSSRTSKSPRPQSSGTSSKSRDIPRTTNSTRTSKSPRRPNSRTDRGPGRDSAAATISRTSTKSLGRESCSSRTPKSPLRQRTSKSPMKRRSSRTCSKNSGPSGRTTTLERKDNSFQNIQLVGEDTITPLKDHHDLESKAPAGRSGSRRKSTAEKSSPDEGSSSIEEHQAPTSSPSSLKSSSGGRRKHRSGRRRSSKSPDPSESDNICKRQQPRRGNSTSNPMRRISSSVSSSKSMCLDSRSDHSPKHPTTRRSNSHNATPSRDASPIRPMRRSFSKSPPPSSSRTDEHFVSSAAIRPPSSKSLLLPESGQESSSDMLRTSTLTIPPQQPRPPLPSREDDASVNDSPKPLPTRPPRRTTSARSPTRVSSFASTGSTTSDDRCPRIPVRHRARPSSSSSGVLQPTRKLSDPPMSIGSRSEHTPTRPTTTTTTTTTTVSSSSSQQSSLEDSTSEFSVLSRARSFGSRKSYHPNPNNKPQRSTTKTSFLQANHKIGLKRQPLSMVPKSSSPGILSDAVTQTKHNQMMSPGNLIGSSARGTAKSIMLPHRNKEGGRAATTSSDASDFSTKRLVVDLQKTPFVADGDEVSTTDGATTGSDCSR